jgi:hypothetical protein
MESVFVLVPADHSAAFEARLDGNARPQVGGPWFVEENGARVYINRSGSLAEELEPEQLAAMEAVVRDPVFYLFDFNGLDLCKRILAVMIDDPLVWIDNDHGVLLSGRDFLARLRARPDWDWRRDRPPSSD